MFTALNRFQHRADVLISGPLESVGLTSTAGLSLGTYARHVMGFRSQCFTQHRQRSLIAKRWHVDRSSCCYDHACHPIIAVDNLPEWPHLLRYVRMGLISAPKTMHA